MARSHLRLRDWAIIVAALAGAAVPAPSMAGPADAPATETIVLIRHGEKPPAGLGQLDCQGLNRSLALPAVIRAKFGVPAALFAPNPAAMKPDGARSYDYIRPLATIEPTAITFGLPVNTSLAYNDIAGLQQALVQPAYHSATVLAAWEHKQLGDLARQLLTAYGGNAGLVPKWQSPDFDSVFIIRINWGAAPPAASFAVSHEGLNGLSTQCAAAGPR